MSFLKSLLKGVLVATVILNALFTAAVIHDVFALYNNVNIVAAQTRQTEAKVMTLAQGVALLLEDFLDRCGPGGIPPAEDTCPRPQDWSPFEPTPAPFEFQPAPRVEPDDLT